MKKNFVFLVYLLAVSNILLGQSKIVREWEIESAATNWIKARNNDSSVTITSISVLNDSNESPLIYEATTDSITILFSGARNCIPIIGYCGRSESSIVELYERKELPCGMQLMMDDYVEQVNVIYYEKQDYHMLYAPRHGVMRQLWSKMRWLCAIKCERFMV